MKSSDPRWIKVAIRKTLRWQGRSRRAEVWWYMLVPVLVTLLIGAIEFVAYAEEDVPTALFYATVAAFCAALLPGISGAIRRLHDLGRSGWWYLMLAMPVAAFVLAPTEEDRMTDAEAFAIVLTVLGAVVLQYWFLQRGTIGDNRFGPDPLMAEENRSPSPAIGIATVHIPLAEGSR